MKRIALFFAIAIAAVSCAQEEVITPELTLLVDSEELVLTPEEGTLPISFKTNVDWTAKIKESDTEAWCVVTPSKGKAGDNTLNLIYLENKNTDNRSATVVFKAMDLTQEIVVTQLQKDVLVLTAEKEYNVPYQGQNLDFKVTHNLDLKVRSDVDWITEVKTKALQDVDLTFAVAPNTGEARTGKITFTAGPFKEEIIVNQDAWVLEFDITPSEDKAFDPEGGVHKVTVASNVDYYVNMEENDWLTMSEVNGEYTFTAAPNDGMSARDVDVRISPKSAKYISVAKTINMSQKAAGAKLDISEFEKRITCLAQSFDLTVDANIEYEFFYKKVVDGEYVDLTDADKWLSHSVSGNTYTFTATENPTWEERSVVLVFSPKDAAYSDMTKTVVVYQYGHAFRMWMKQLTSIDGYDSTKKVRLALYGDKLLLANTTNVYLMNPATGEVETSISMPSGVNAHSVLVDDAGNVMIAADALFDSDRNDIELVLYHLPDPMNPVPEEVFSYNIGNYYGSQTGNVRVKGDIKKNAVITAVVSDGQDEDNPEDGAVLMWEIKDGVCSDWTWTNAPYTAWGIESLCAYPAGNTLADGLFYIGYGGDYNLKYASDIVMKPVLGDDGNYVESTDWTTSYVTGSSWQENYNCISTVVWKGKAYAAIMMGCHFNYDDADMLLLNIDDPGSAVHVYTYSGTNDVERNDAWANMWWTGNGAYSDILLIPTDDALLMIGADSNYGTIACVAIM